MPITSRLRAATKSIKQFWNQRLYFTTLPSCNIHGWIRPQWNVATSWYACEQGLAVWVCRWKDQARPTYNVKTIQTEPVRSSILRRNPATISSTSSLQTSTSKVNSTAASLILKKSCSYFSCSLSIWCIIIQLFSIVILWSWTACWHFHGVFHSRLKSFLFS